MSKPPATTDLVTAPYGDRSPAEPIPQTPWRGESLALLVLALTLFLSAGITVTIATVQTILTFNQSTGADIGVGLMLVVFITLVLSACGVLSLAYRARRD